MRRSLFSALVAGTCILAASCARLTDSDMELADAAMRSGDYQAAASHFQAAIRRQPRLTRAHHGLGAALWRLEKYDEALASYTKALRLEPDNGKVAYDRALAYWRLGEPKKAIRDFELAMKINPADDNAHNGLAWVLSTSPEAQVRNGKRALELATAACEMTDWRNPYHLSTLAAANAEVGDFESALRWHREAMASPDFPEGKLDRARQRLALYEQGKPYRERFD